MAVSLCCHCCHSFTVRWIRPAPDTTANSPKCLFDETRRQKKKPRIRLKRINLFVPQMEVSCASICVPYECTECGTKYNITKYRVAFCRVVVSATAPADKEFSYVWKLKNWNDAPHLITIDAWMGASAHYISHFAIRILLLLSVVVCCLLFHSLFDAKHKKKKKDDWDMIRSMLCSIYLLYSTFRWAVQIRSTRIELAIQRVQVLFKCINISVFSVSKQKSFFPRLSFGSVAFAEVCVHSRRKEERVIIGSEERKKNDERFETIQVPTRMHDKVNCQHRTIEWYEYRACQQRDKFNTIIVRENHNKWANFGPFSFFFPDFHEFVCTFMIFM